MFKGKSTYTCLFFLEKEKSKALHYSCDEQVKLAKRMHYEDIPWNLLDAEKGWNLNQNKVTNKIRVCWHTFCLSFAKLAMVLRH